MAAGRYRVCAALVGTLALGLLAWPVVSAAQFKLGPGGPGEGGKSAGPVKINNALLAQATQALLKEYQAHAKDPKSAKLREKCDYFTQNKSADVTPDFVIKGLEQSVSRDAEAYVKWQFLSGLSGKFPDELAKRAIAVYKRAPAPVLHPGTDRRGLQNIPSRLKKEDVASANKQYEEMVQQRTAPNEMIVTYRDELFSRLPVSYDMLRAGFEDAAERAAQGVNANKIFDAAAGATRSWALMAGKPSEIRGLGGQVADLRDAVAGEGMKVFTQLETAKDGKVKWKTEGVLGVAKCDDLLKFLGDQMSSGGGGLKFKDK